MGNYQNNRSVWPERGWVEGGDDAGEQVGANHEGVCVLCSLNLLLEAVVSH